MASLATLPTKPDVDDDDYYDVFEAADKLRVGHRWLRDGFNHRGFPGSRMCGKLIFDGRDLREIYRMHRTPARPVPRQRRAGIRPRTA